MQLIKESGYDQVSMKFTTDRSIRMQPQQHWLAPLWMPVSSLSLSCPNHDSRMDETMMICGRPRSLEYVDEAAEDTIAVAVNMIVELACQ